MSQYSSRLYVEVKKVKDWDKLSDLNVEQYGLWSDDFKTLNEIFLYLDVWSCEEGSLFDLAQEISMRISDCIIFADTNDIEAEPYNHIVYYLGDRVKTSDIDENIQEETSLMEPVEWFRQHKVKLDKKQKEYLESFNFNFD